MNKKQPTLKKYSNIAGIAGLVLGMVIFLVPASAFGQAFQGSDSCQTCHEVPYRDWSASGHPYKLMKSEEARHRPIPLPLGLTWDDVSYVIGGYKWKSRYIDADGYIVTVTEDEGGNEVDGMNQYNYLTGEWVNYHAGEENVPYDTCGTCHTTNWVANPDPTNLTGNQDGLPGMHGTFDAGGVHCEQCHGNAGGDLHMTGPDRIDTSAEACGVCHYREAAPGAENNVIPAAGGFIKHHEQYNEHLAGPHANMNCVTCHDPHKRGEFSIKDKKDCGTCHPVQAASYAMDSMADYGVECKDCHMPYATKSANQLGPFEGDVQTHLFYINTDADANMFTEDGTHVALDFAVPGKPDRLNKGAATLDFACIRCHETGDMTELGKFAKNFHGTDPSVSELEYIGINPGLTGNWWGGPDRNGEGFLLEVADAGGALTLVVSFYTYDNTGKQIWLVGFGPANTGMTSNVTLYISEGRIWGEDANPSDFTEVFGTGIFNFPACDVGSFTITPNAKYMGLGMTGIGYDLSRDLTIPEIACPSMVN